MTAAKHTPGPWVAKEDRTVSAAGEPLLRCYAGRNEDANARLIAAAPELLGALQWFVARVDAGEVKSKRTYAEFKALIAKATGAA